MLLVRTYELARVQEVSKTKSQYIIIRSNPKQLKKTTRITAWEFTAILEYNTTFVISRDLMRLLAYSKQY